MALILWTVQLIAALPAPSAPRVAYPVEQTVRVNLLTEDSRQGDFIQLPIAPDQLRLFAQGLASGKGLSTREWAGTFTPERHAQLMSKLTAAGLVEWVRDGDPKAGRRLTARGSRVIEKLAAPYPIYPVNG